MPEGPASDLRARLRALPSVQRVIDELGDVARARAVAAARRAVDQARATVRTGAPAPALGDIVAAARADLAALGDSSLRPVINATGVLIHTNLGRAPLGDAQLAAVHDVAGGYSNLEYDLEAGRRGSRYEHAQRLLVELTGAESALVVNNNAAAVLLVLAALCAGREVVISRGELVEIGGEFRIPDVMSTSGARLVEVGTTNRTHLVDYERAVSANTAALLKVHPSNYTISGFTASVGGADLARLAKGRGVLFIYDVGSGWLSPIDTLSQASTEPAVDLALADGADIVTLSGDKLLGGPQAGVIAGRSDLVARIARHPLLRALRVDKMTLAALEATARALSDDAPRRLPLWSMALAPLEELERRAHALAARLGDSIEDVGTKVEVVATRAVTGGGSLPGSDVGSWALALAPGDRSAAELERALRKGSPPVVARIEDDRVIVDLRAVLESQDDMLGGALTAALR